MSGGYGHPDLMHARIDRFLSDYEPAGLGHPSDGSDLSILRDALATFLLDEQWLGDEEALAPALHAVADIRMLSGAQGLNIDRHAAMIQTGLTTLAARLKRSDHVNQIQREQLMILTNMMRSSRSPSASSPE